MKLILTSTEKTIVKRFWKQGEINIFKFYVDKRSLKKLEAIGVIRKISLGKYHLERERYLNLVEKEEKNSTLSKFINEIKGAIA